MRRRWVKLRGEWGCCRRRQMMGQREAAVLRLLEKV